MTPEENTLLAMLDGFHSFRGVDGEDYMRHPDGKCTVGIVYPDYDDERNLMPLAWKNKLCIEWDEEQKLWCAFCLEDGIVPIYFNCDDDDPKIAIQQALLAIAREKFDG